MEPLSEPREESFPELQVRWECARVAFHRCERCQLVLALHHKEPLQSWKSLVVEHLPHWELQVWLLPEPRKSAEPAPESLEMWRSERCRWVKLDAELPLLPPWLEATSEPADETSEALLRSFMPVRHEEFVQRPNHKYVQVLER